MTAGAFAAFLSTSSGLTVSVAGVLSQDVLRGSVRDFRIAAALAVSVPFLLSFGASSLPVADVVGLAFAVAASSFCPLLLLGIWWRGLTDVGATAGLLAGGGLATARGVGDDRRRRPRRLGRRAARAAGRVDRADRLRGDGRSCPSRRRAAPRPGSPGRWCGCTRRRPSSWPTMTARDRPA